MVTTSAVANTSSAQNVPSRHLVLALLSLASQHGRSRVPIADFFTAFAAVVDECKEQFSFPVIDFSGTPDTLYSKRLDDALQSLIGNAVALPNPELQYLEVLPDAAERHLVHLKEKYGQDYIDGLARVAEAFIQKLPGKVPA
jgi:hypothetical protein